MRTALSALVLLTALAVHAAEDPETVRTAQVDAADKSPSRARPVREFRPVVKSGLEGLMVEFGGLPDPSSRADSTFSARASAYALWQPMREWEFRAGLRVDGWLERGGAHPFDDWRADLGDTYARYRSGDMRITIGAQTIIWGRVDEISPIDRVSRVDLGRFILDDLADRRLPQLALRWEHTLGDYKLDAVALPSFRGARLPDVQSVWSPIDRAAGRLIGVAPSPAISMLVGAADVRQDHSGAGGAALRLTRTGAPPFDFGLTLARTRQTLPYYSADPAGPTLTATYPYNSLVGADVEFVTGGTTWRSEIAVTDHVPLTRADGRTIYARALDWVAGVEFFPGEGETRISLQLTARSLDNNDPVLQLTEYYGINGEISTTFQQGRWRLATRFFSGLNVHDVFVAPKLSYLGWEPHELYVAARHFNGEPRTIGGFHRDHDMVAIGLIAKF